MAHKDMYGGRTYSVKGLDEVIEASGMNREEVERQYGVPSLHELPLLKQAVCGTSSGTRG